MNETVTYPVNATATSVTSAQRVVPLLQSLSRAEELVSALAMRLDPVTNHSPAQEKAGINSPTVTGRINGLGDTLQYLLDNIEL